MRTDLQGIAIELYHLGIRDLAVANPQVAAAFRLAEEVLVLALSGDCPEPRVVEAVPFLLARRSFRASVAYAFADVHDQRVKTRLGWLSDVTLALSRLSTMPVTVNARSRVDLSAFIKFGAKATESDSLGHPSHGVLSPIWRRWNITYAGTLQDFQRRTVEVDLAVQTARMTMEEGW